MRDDHHKAERESLVCHEAGCPWDLGYCTARNARDENQDTATLVWAKGRKPPGFFGVYDGHGGAATALVAAHRLHRFFWAACSDAIDPRAALKQAHAEIDATLSVHQIPAGSTTAVAVIDPLPRKLYAANLGDSRVVLVRAGGRVRQLTRDHSVALQGGATMAELRQHRAEIEAIERWGGHIEDGYVVDPVSGDGVNMTRALGDSYIPGLKKNSRPYLATTTWHPGDTLILASDGVWHSTWPTPTGLQNAGMRVREVVIPAHCRTKLAAGKTLTPIEQRWIQTRCRPLESVESASSQLVGAYAQLRRREGATAEQVAREIVTLSRNSGDNSTVIVVYLS